MYQSTTVYGGTKRCTEGNICPIRLAVGRLLRQTVPSGHYCTEVQKYQTVYGRCTAVGVRRAAVFVGVCSGLVSYTPSFVRRQVSGWCFLARCSSPSSPQAGRYHCIFCQETAPPPLPQVFPRSVRTSGNRACSSMVTDWSRRGLWPLLNQSLTISYRTEPVG